MTITGDTPINPSTAPDAPIEPASDAPQTLGTLLKAPTGTPGEAPPIISAQVVTCDDRDVVLLGPTPTTTSSGAYTGSLGGTVEVVTQVGIVYSRDPDATAVPVSDPARRETVLRLALSRLATRYQDVSETQLRDSRDLVGLRTRLRAYLIERLEGDDLDRDQVDNFLEEFDLPAYRPTFRVDYTIRGSYVVIDSTYDAVRADAGGYLRPDLGELDDVDDVSSDYSVTVDVEQIDEPD